MVIIFPIFSFAQIKLVKKLCAVLLRSLTWIFGQIQENLTLIFFN